MKFAIFSNDFAPDWIISSVPVIGSLSSIRLKLLLKQIIVKLLGTTVSTPRISDIPSDSSGLSDSQAKAVVSSLTFITLSITRVFSSTYVGRSKDSTTALDTSLMVAELSQLGLHKDLAQGYATIYSEHREKLVDWNVRVMGMTENRMLDVKWRLVCNLMEGGYNEAEEATGSTNTTTTTDTSSNRRDESASMQAAAKSEERALENRMEVYMAFDLVQGNSKVEGKKNKNVGFYLSLDVFDTLKAELECVRDMMNDIERN